MCGIAGIITRDPVLAMPARIKAMTDPLAHRGPDGEGSWQGGPALLGHRRLAIIDLSDRGIQPMAYGNRYQIVHDGRIYNHPELREELKTKGYSFRSQTDTEVIAAAYMEYGSACVDRLDGMFAFVIWDEQEEILFAAVDRFGEKPFFYYLDEHQFLFASEMKALWAAGIPRLVNQKMLFNFLTIDYTDNPNNPEETFFEHISRLAPAHTLHFDPRKQEIELERYWDIDFDHEISIGEDLAMERLLELLTISVNRRLRSDVPVGTCLGDGLDGATIAFLCDRLQASVFSREAFSAIFPALGKNEESMIDAIGENFHLRSNKTPVTAEEMPRLLEKAFHYQEEPFTSCRVLAQYQVYAAAQAQGIPVLLDRHGANEILAGYQKYYKWYWQELFRKRRLFSSGELKKARQRGVGERFGIKNVLAALFPDFASVVLERRYLVNALQHEDLDPAFIQLQSREAYFMTPTILRLKGKLYFDTCMHGLSERLRHTDRNSMAHGREVRLPFLGHELVEFIFSLPPSFKIRNGATSWILRKSMESHLPESIIWRAEKNGTDPLLKTFMELPVTRELTQEARRILVDQQVLKKEALDKKKQPHVGHAADHYEWRYLISAFLFR